MTKQIWIVERRDDYRRLRRRHRRPCGPFRPLQLCGRCWRAGASGWSWFRCCCWQLRPRLYRWRAAPFVGTTKTRTDFHRSRPEERKKSVVILYNEHNYFWNRGSSCGSYLNQGETLVWTTTVVTQQSVPRSFTILLSTLLVKGVFSPDRGFFAPSHFTLPCC